MAAEKYYYGTGRRKTSTARVFLKPGKGKVTLNGAEPEKALKNAISRMVMLQPFDIINQLINRLWIQIKMPVVHLHIRLPLLHYDPA